MQSIQLEQNVTRCDEFSLPVTTCGVRSERVVAGHVRMNDVNRFSTHKLFQLACGLYVESVSQGQRDDLLG
jgi:hypothetical protein